MKPLKSIETPHDSIVTVTPCLSFIYARKARSVRSSGTSKRSQSVNSLFRYYRPSAHKRETEREREKDTHAHARTLARVQTPGCAHPRRVSGAMPPRDLGPMTLAHISFLCLRVSLSDSNTHTHTHTLSLSVQCRRAFILGARMGSEKAKKGRARLTNPFLYSSSLQSPRTICHHTHTHTHTHTRMRQP
jgi:hypothetical protein